LRAADNCIIQLFISAFADLLLCDGCNRKFKQMQNCTKLAINYEIFEVLTS